MEEEKEIEVDWDNIDEKCLEKDPELLNLMHYDAVKLTNSIGKVSDKHNSKAIFLLTGCMLLIAMMIPEIIDMTQKIKDIWTCLKFNWSNIFFVIGLFVVLDIIFRFVPYIVLFITYIRSSLKDKEETISDKDFSRFIVAAIVFLICLILGILGISGIKWIIGKILAMEFMMQLIQQNKAFYLDNLKRVWFALFLSCFFYSCRYILMSMWKFYTILTIESKGFPYFNPEELLKNELYRKGSIKTKIEMIKILQKNIITEADGITNKKDSLLVQGRRFLLFGVIVGLCSFVFLLIIL